MHDRAVRQQVAERPHDLALVAVGREVGKLGDLEAYRPRGAQYEVELGEREAEGSRGPHARRALGGAQPIAVKDDGSLTDHDHVRALALRQGLQDERLARRVRQPVSAMLAFDQLGRGPTGRLADERALVADGAVELRCRIRLPRNQRRRQPKPARGQPSARPNDRTTDAAGSRPVDDRALKSGEQAKHRRCHLSADVLAILLGDSVNPRRGARPREH